MKDTFQRVAWKGCYTAPQKMLHHLQPLISHLYKHSILFVGLSASCFAFSQWKESSIDLMHGYFQVLDKPAQVFPGNCQSCHFILPAWKIFLKSALMKYTA